MCGFVLVHPVGDLRRLQSVAVPSQAPEASFVKKTEACGAAAIPLGSREQCGRNIGRIGWNGGQGQIL